MDLSTHFHLLLLNKDVLMKKTNKNVFAWSWFSTKEIEGDALRFCYRLMLYGMLF